MPSIKPYLQLVRLPNVFTAAADSLAGWLLVGGTLDQPRRWLPLLGASMAIYAGGDRAERRLRRRDRPRRAPGPSAAVGPGLATVRGDPGRIAPGDRPDPGRPGGSTTSRRAAVLALAACGPPYDLGLRRTVLGPQVMGACRGLNLLLGMSQAPALGGPAGWLAAGALALFVAGLTWISRNEAETGRDRRGDRRDDASRISPCWPWPPSPGRRRTLPGREPRRGRSCRSRGCSSWPLVALIVNLADGRAVREPTPATLQHAVKTGVLSLVWLDVALVAAARGPVPAPGRRRLLAPGLPPRAGCTRPERGTERGCLAGIPGPDDPIPPSPSRRMVG